MLVNCPRCGFTQPQDKYCARCGVDMETFRPPRASLMQRTFGNPVIQISLVLLVAGSVGFSIYQKRKNELRDRVTYLKGVQVARSVGSSNSNAGDEEKESTLPAEFLSEEGVDSASSSAEGKSTIAPGGAAAAVDPKKQAGTAAGAAATPGAKTNPKGPVTMQLTFAEVSQQAVMQIYETSRSTGQFNSFGDYYAGILPDIDRRISSAGREIRILGREQRNIDAQHPFQFFQGMRQSDPEAEIGFTYYVELNEGEGPNIRGNLEVIRSWREPTTPGAVGNTMQKTNFPAVFELANGAGFFMSSLIKPTNLPPADTDLMNIIPFQVLRSPEFRAHASEYVLFLEFTRH